MRAGKLDFETSTDDTEVELLQHRTGADKRGPPGVSHGASAWG